MHQELSYVLPGAKIENNVVKVLLFSDLNQITFINISMGKLEKNK